MAAVVVAAIGAGAAYVWKIQTASAVGEGETLTAVASRGKLRVTVTERGNLEAVKTVDGICEVSGYENKIIFIVPEGTKVEKDDVVVRIDTDKIDQNIAQQEIKVNEAKEKVEATEQELEVERNQGESDIAAAELELKLAKLDLEKYKMGDLQVETNDIQGQIALAKFELEQAIQELTNAKMLVRKGFRESEYLRQKEEDFRRAEFYLARDKEKLNVLTEYDSRRKIAEFEAKAVEAEKKVERAHKNAEAKVKKLESTLTSAKARVTLQEKELEEYRQQKEKCEIKAAAPGVVAYSNERWWSSDRQIREGAMVHFRQRLFTLPDMTSMQVKVNVHESMIKKVKVGQTAKIRVESYPDLLLTGSVTKVSPLADSTNSWQRGGVKAYTTIVVIDGTPEENLKPGMTAEVEVLVNEIDDTLLVPVQSVTEHDQDHFVYVKAGEGFARRPVDVGDNNNRFVEVTGGLEAGEQVALDARARGIADFEEEDARTQLQPEPQPEEEQPAVQEVATSG